MHPNPAFRTPDAIQNLDFARKRAFATLTLNGDLWPVMAHVPFILTAGGASAELHLVRSNPIVKMTDEPAPAVLVVSGADGYISPDWYEMDDQVPTWNYIAVHLRGTLNRLDQSEMPGLLDRLSNEMESRLAPKPVWKREKMTPGAFDRMARMVVPFRFEITQVDGTWKLGQNKPDDARIAAANSLGTTGFGMEVSELSNRMRDLPDA